MVVPKPEHPRHPARDRCQESACRCKRRSAHWKPQEPKEPLTHGYFVRAEGFRSINVRVKGISGGGWVDCSRNSRKHSSNKKNNTWRRDCTRKKLHLPNHSLTTEFLFLGEEIDGCRVA